MKTFVLIRNGKIIESGRVENNCDYISAIGRKKREGEIVGYGRNKREAFENALERSLSDG